MINKKKPINDGNFKPEVIDIKAKTITKDILNTDSMRGMETHW